MEVKKNSRIDITDWDIQQQSPSNILLKPQNGIDQKETLFILFETVKLETQQSLSYNFFKDKLSYSF